MNNILYIFYVRLFKFSFKNKELLIVWMENSIVKHLTPSYITFLEQPFVNSKELTFLYIEIWVH